MSGIQILLIGGVIAIFIYYIARFRNALADLIILGIFSAAAVFLFYIPMKLPLLPIN
jgi:hypothetical protein